MQKAERPIIAGLIIIIIVVGVRSCQPVRVNMGYDPVRERIAPVVRAGDVIKVDASVRWIVDACDPSTIKNENGSMTCTVARNLPQRRGLPYECTDKNCDPEVIVDDTGTLKGPLALARGPERAPVPNVIDMTCKGSVVQFNHEWGTDPVAVGSRVRWTSPDGSIPNWTVMLQPDGSHQDATKFCKEATAMFTPDDDNNMKNTCTLTADAPPTVMFNVAPTGMCTTQSSDTFMVK